MRSHLDPCLTALPKVTSKLDALAGLVRGDAGQIAVLWRLRALISAKLGELDASFALYRERGAQAARAALQADGTRVTMDQIRHEIDAMTNTERAAQRPARNGLQDSRAIG